MASRCGTCLAGQPVFGYQSSRYECELKAQFFNLFLQLQNPFIGSLAFSAASGTRNPVPDDILFFVPYNLLADWLAILEALLDCLVNSPMQHELLAAAVWASSRRGRQLVHFAGMLFLAHRYLK